MAEIVSAYVVPHTPSFIADVKANGDRSETAQHFSKVRQHFEASAPDVIISICNDHFNTFFFENWPTFAIGIADESEGPSDQTPEMPWYRVTVASDVARHLLDGLLKDEFDPASLLEFQLDHGHLIPLHFLTPAMSVPIVPIFVNCVVPPLPRSTRCRRLGQSIAAIVRDWDPRLRVAIVGSGSLSLEIGGPRAFEGKTFGIPDPAWASWILERISTCDHDGLIHAATQDRMLAAGNVSGELLSWITVLGVVGPRVPDILIDQPDLGNAFAAWSIGGRPA